MQTQDQIKARIQVLASEIEANEVETREYKREMDQLQAMLDFLPNTRWVRPGGQEITVSTFDGIRLHYNNSDGSGGGHMGSNFWQSLQPAQVATN